jgi:RNA polymerase sigma factor (sigma-70 family)
MGIQQTKSALGKLRQALQTPGGLTDGQLLERFASARDEAAFEALVRRHAPMVLGVCQRVTDNVQDAEDAFQATFLVLVRKAGSLRDREAVGCWLHGVARRTALEARARTLRRQTRERQVECMPHPAVEQQLPDLELRQLLDQELDRLPEKYRQAIVLCDLEGRSRKEVATQLGIPEGTLSSRLAAGRKRLADRLVKRGLAVCATSLASALASQASASVPAKLVMSAIRTALSVVCSPAAVVPASVAILTEGVMKSMFLAKMKSTTLAIIVACTIGFGVGAIAQTATPGSNPPAQAQQPAPEEAPWTARVQHSDSFWVEVGAPYDKLAHFLLTRGPASEVSDEDFLRRVSLDLRGVPPTALELHLFKNDDDPAKREKLVQFLLQDPTAMKKLVDWMVRSRDVPGGVDWWVMPRVNVNLARPDELQKLIDKLKQKTNLTPEEKNALDALQQLQQSLPPGTWSLDLDRPVTPADLDRIILKKWLEQMNPPKEQDK